MKGSVATLTIMPSRRAAAILLGAHVLAGAAVAMAVLPAVPRAGLIAAVVVHALWSSRRKQPALRLRCQADGGLGILEGDEALPAVLAPDSMVWPGLVVLRYRLGNERRMTTRIVFADSMPEDDFRRLRVWMRWAPLTVEAGRHPEEN